MGHVERLTASRCGRNGLGLDVDVVHDCGVPDAIFESDTPAPVLTIDSEIQAYDVAPDGRRFLVLRASPPDFLPFQVLVNWQAKAR